MKVFLDDERTPPEGWVLVRWPEEVIELLKTGEVKELSLDHDLGDDDHGTGYDVVLWIEEAVATTDFIPPNMKVHSANSSARMKMEAGIDSIKRCLTQRKWNTPSAKISLIPKTIHAATHALQAILDNWDDQTLLDHSELMVPHDQVVGLKNKLQGYGQKQSQLSISFTPSEIINLDVLLHRVLQDFTCLSDDYFDEIEGLHKYLEELDDPFH